MWESVLRKQVSVEICISIVFVIRMKKESYYFGSLKSVECLFEIIIPCNLTSR